MGLESLDGGSYRVVSGRTSRAKGAHPDCPRTGGARTSCCILPARSINGPFLWELAVCRHTHPPIHYTPLLHVFHSRSSHGPVALSLYSYIHPHRLLNATDTHHLTAYTVSSIYHISAIQCLLLFSTSVSALISKISPSILLSSSRIAYRHTLFLSTAHMLCVRACGGYTRRRIESCPAHYLTGLSLPSSFLSTRSIAVSQRFVGGRRVLFYLSSLLVQVLR